MYQKKKTATIPAPEGSHVAVCFQVIDMGTHTEQTKFGEQTNRKVRITFELSHELHIFTEQRGPEPFVVGREFNCSLHKKAGFRKFVEDWKGKALTEDEVKAIESGTRDINKELAGSGCMLSVAHSESGGNIYANIKSIMPLPKGTAKPDAVNAVKIFNMDDPDIPANVTVLNSLPQWMQDKVMASQEYPGWSAARNGNPAAMAPTPSSEPQDEQQLPF